LRPAGGIVLATSAALLLAALAVPIARGEAPACDTPAGVVSSFVGHVSALAATHAELALFPEYVTRLAAREPVEFRNGVKPFAVCFDRNTAPVITKRRIRPSDCGTNGVFLLFVLDDGTRERQAPADTVTYFPNLKLTLYADVVLGEEASAELRKKLEDLVAEHKTMLSDLDREAAGRTPGDAARRHADPPR